MGKLDHRAMAAVRSRGSLGHLRAIVDFSILTAVQSPALISIIHVITSSLQRTRTRLLLRHEASPRSCSFDDGVHPLDALSQLVASLAAEQALMRRSVAHQCAASEEHRFALQTAAQRKETQAADSSSPPEPTNPRPSHSADIGERQCPKRVVDVLDSQDDLGCEYPSNTCPRKLEQDERDPRWKSAATCGKQEGRDSAVASPDLDSDSNAENPIDPSFAACAEMYARVKRWRCELCGKQFYLESQQRTHLARHIECPEPSCSFSASKRVVARHRAARHGFRGTYCCNACSVTGHSIYRCSKKLTRMELIAQRQLMFEGKFKVWR